MENAFSSIHHGQLVNRHQGFAELLIVQAVRHLAASAFAGVVGVDCFLSKQLFHLLERRLLLAAEKQQRIAVANDGIRVVLVDGFELGLSLQDDACRDFAASDGGDQLLKIGDLPNVCKFVDEAADMNREPAAVHIIRLFAQQIEQLRISHADQEVETGVCVRHNQEQCCTLVPNGVQMQLVIGRNLAKLLNIKDRKACSAAHQNTLGCLAGRHLILEILPDREVFRLLLGELFKQLINLVLEILVILPHLHLIEQINERGEVLLFLGQLIVDIPDQGDVQQRFGLLMIGKALK